MKKPTDSRGTCSLTLGCNDGFGVYLSSIRVCEWTEIHNKMCYMGFYTQLLPLWTALDLNNVSYPQCEQVKLHLVRKNRLLPPPSTSWPVHVLPLHTFDMWAQELENCREESASSLCWLLRCTHWTAVTPVFVLLPVSCSLTRDRAYLGSLRLFTLEWTGVTWEWDSFRCILKLTNMCSPWRQDYLPAPGLVLPWNVTWKGASKDIWEYLCRARKDQTRFDPACRSNFFFWWNMLL